MNHHFRSYSEQQQPLQPHQQPGHLVNNLSQNNDNNTNTSQPLDGINSTDDNVRVHPDAHQSLERLFNLSGPQTTVPLRNRNLPASFFNPSWQQGHNKDNTSNNNNTNQATNGSNANLHSRSTSLHLRQNYQPINIHMRTQSTLTPVGAINHSSPLRPATNGSATNGNGSISNTNSGSNQQLATSSSQQQTTVNAFGGLTAAGQPNLVARRPQIEDQSARNSNPNSNDTANSGGGGANIVHNYHNRNYSSPAFMGNPNGQSAVSADSPFFQPNQHHLNRQAYYQTHHENLPSTTFAPSNNVNNIVQSGPAITSTNAPKTFIPTAAAAPGPPLAAGQASQSVVNYPSHRSSSSSQDFYYPPEADPSAHMDYFKAQQPTTLTTMDTASYGYPAQPSSYQQQQFQQPLGPARPVPTTPTGSHFPGTTNGDVGSEDANQQQTFHISHSQPCMPFEHSLVSNSSTIILAPMSQTTSSSSSSNENNSLLCIPSPAVHSRSCSFDDHRSHPVAHARSQSTLVGLSNVGAVNPTGFPLCDTTSQPASVGMTGVVTMGQDQAMIAGPSATTYTPLTPRVAEQHDIFNDWSDISMYSQQEKF